MKWSTHSRRIDPISRSAKPFCQGEAGAVGLSRMPYGQKIKTVAKMAVVQAPTMKQLSPPFPTAPLQFAPQDPVFSSQILIPQQQLLVHRPVM
jgi:hypothetical protein